MRPLVLGIVKGVVLGALLLGVLSMMSFDYWKTFDWCPQERWDFGLLAVAFGGGVGSFFGLLSGGAALRRHQDLKYLADSEGVELVDRADNRLTERSKNLLAKVGNASLRRVMTWDEQDGQGSLSMGDLSVSDMDEDNQVEHWTVALFHRPGWSLPQFVLQRRGFGLAIVAKVIGLQEICFAEEAGLSKRYFLSGSSEDAVRQLFNHSVRDHFSSGEGCEVGAEGDWLVIAAPGRRHLSATGRKVFRRQAREIVAVLASARSNVEITPSSPSAESAAPVASVSGSVSNRQAMAFFDQSVPRSVPWKVLSPYVSPLLALGVFGGFFVSAGVMAVVSLFVAPPVVALCLIALPVLAGSVLLCLALRLYRKRLRLLREGLPVKGLIESVRKTAWQLPMPRYRVQVHYEVKGSKQVGWANLSSDTVEEAWKAQEEKRAVPLIYDPQAPQNCLLVWQLVTSSRLHPSTRGPAGVDATLG